MADQRLNLPEAPWYMQGVPTRPTNPRISGIAYSGVSIALAMAAVALLVRSVPPEVKAGQISPRKPRTLTLYRGGAGPFNSATEANRLLDAFPDAQDLPNVSTVYKIKVKDAKHCLVHVLNLHDSSRPNLSERVRLFQDRLYTLLTHMIQLGYNNFYGESELLPFPPDKEHLLEGKLWDSQEIGRDKYSAIDMLAEEGKIIVRPYETIDTYVAAHDEMAAGKPGKAVFDWREDELLARVATNNDPMAETAYGWGHVWFDNIQRWNAKHPDNMFSLIEVGLHSDRRVLRQTAMAQDN